MKRILLFLCVLIISASIESLGQEQGTIDRNFGENGFRLVNLLDSAQDFFKYTDSKILSNGDYFISGLHPSFANDGNGEVLIKMKANGTPDSSFSKTGYQKFGVSTANRFDLFSQAIGYQPGSGKITVFSLSSTTDIITLHRFKPNGNFDSSFGSNGVGYTTIKNFNSQYNLISYYYFSYQPDGKLLIGGTARVNSANQRAFLYRLKSDGTIDSTFGTFGLHEYLTNEYSYFKFITPAQNDSLFMGAYNESDSKLKLIKLDINGIQDMSFGNSNGVASFYPSVGDSGPNQLRVVQLNDNRILLVHVAENFGVMATYMLHPNGLLDNSFYGNGTHKTFFFNARIYTLIKIAKLGNGELRALVGNSAQPTNSLSIIKIKTTGTVDSVFGVNGIYTSNIFSEGLKGVYSGWVTSNDSIKLFAFGHLANGSTTYHASTLLLNPDGSIENSYAINGNAVCKIIASQDYLSDIETLGTGKTYFLGFEVIKNKLFLGRLDSTGKLDYTFGSQGIKNFAPASGLVYGTIVKRTNLITNPADTSIYCASYSIGTSSFILHKFRKNGEYDVLFGNNGQLDVPLTKPVFSIPKILQLSDGKFLVLIGSLNTPTNSSADILIVRLNNNGTKDLTFGTNGIVTIDQILSFCSSSCSGSRDFAKDIIYTSDGKILVTGSLQGIASNDFSAMFRLNNNGTKDLTFGANGIVTFFSSGIQIKTTSLNEQEHKKYIVSFNYYNPLSGARSSTLARYNYNGSPDTTFSTTTIPNPTAGGRYAVQNISVQEDKKINVLCVSDPSYTGKPYIVRLKITGKVDSTFGTNGLVIIDTLRILPATDVELDNFTYFRKDIRGRLITGAVGQDQQLRDVLLTRIYTGDILPSHQLCSTADNTLLISSIEGLIYQWQVDQGSGFVNISDDINYSGTNSMNLQLTAIPSSWNGYQYRCLVDGNISETITLKFTNYWIGAISTAWENPANWSCGTLPDANTDVILNSGTVIVVSSNTTIRTLMLRPGANLTVNPGYSLTIIY